MHGDSAQTCLTTGESLSQHIAPHALPAGGVDRQGNQSTTNQNDNPGWRDSIAGPKAPNPVTTATASLL